MDSRPGTWATAAPALALILIACVAGSSTDTSAQPDPTLSSVTTSQVVDPSTTTTAPAFASLDALLDEFTSDNDPVGVAAAALYPDGAMWLGSSGMAERDAQIPIDPSGRFEVASITKTFMSVLTLRLVEEGVVGLDDRVGDYVPDYPVFEDMTIRMLLGHRAGVHDPSPQLVSDLDGPPDPERVFTSTELVAASASGSPVFPPGSRHEYSNANYWILAAALEEATGVDTASLLDSYVIGPMELESTSLFDSSLPEVEVVNAYVDLDLDGSPDPMGNRPLPGFVTPAWTAGAMISSATDLVRFLDGVFTGGIVSEESLAEMIDTSNGGGGYGLGIYSNRGYWGHDGGIAGFLSAVFHDPRTGVTVAALTNRFGPDAPQADALAYRLLPAANDLSSG